MTPLALSNQRIPPEIGEIDEQERRRRAQLPPTPKYQLSDAEKEILYQRIPELREIDARLQRELTKIDLDDHRVGSWAYRELIHSHIPWWIRPSFWIAALTATISLIVRVGLTTTSMVALLVERAIGSIGALVWLFLAFMTWSTRERRGRLDVLARCLVMFAMSCSSLVLISMIASVGHGVASTIAGVFVRFVPLIISLWWWSDLNEEIDHRDEPVFIVYKWWRAGMTLGVIIAGGFGRLLGVNRGLGDVLALGAESLRHDLGKRFPVMLSLCRDPRGFHLAACLGILIGIGYLTYVMVFATDLMQERDHRRCETPLTRWLVARGVYRPDVRKELKTLALSGGPGSFLPSPPMLLRKKEDDIATDSSYFTTEITLPILSLLEKETEIMKKEGIDRWLKPRDEQIPLSENLTYAERSLSALENWANLPTDEEANMSYAEFFETLEEEDYTYDPNSGNWVFTDEPGDVKEPANMKEEETVPPMASGIMEKLRETEDEDGVNLNELERVIKEIAGVDLLDLASSPDMDPSLKREILKHHGRSEDDLNDPPSDEVIKV